MDKSLEFYISYALKLNDGAFSVGSSAYTQKEYMPLTSNYIFDQLEDIKKKANAEQILLLTFGRFEK